MSTKEQFEAHIKTTAWHQVLSGAAKDDDDGASVFRMAMMAASEAWTAAERQSAEGIETMAHRLQVANDCCERLMSACTDAGCPDGVNMADWIRKNATRTPQSVTRDAMQEKVIACGFKYWRASDAHGVVGTTKQAEEFIADLIGVEVEIKA